MPHHLWRDGSFLLAVATISCASAVPGSTTSPQPTKQSTRAQSFHAADTFPPSTFTPTSNACVVYEVAQGSGFVKIGSSSVDVSIEALDEVLDRGQCFGVLNSGETAGYHFFTAKNGDRLVAAQRVQSQSPSRWNGTFGFSGGTGRFAGAAGTGTFTVTFRGSPEQGTAIYDGQIALS